MRVLEREVWGGTGEMGKRGKVCRVMMGRVKKGRER